MPTTVIKSAEGVVVEILWNHRLSEKDTDEDRFFILLDISSLSLNHMFYYILACSPVNEFFWITKKDSSQNMVRRFTSFIKFPSKILTKTLMYD